MNKLIVCVVTAALVGIGCNHHSAATGDDPVSTLASPQAATNYDYPFWNDQFQRKTDAWKQALSFCNQPDHKFLINCQPVLAVAAPRVPFSTGVEHPLGIPAVGPSAQPQATR